MEKNTVITGADRRTRYFKRLLWGILILSPLLSGLVIGMVSHTSIFHLDAWNTTWNDEAGYYNAVRIMRTIGLPKGLGGYNEVVSKYPAFGAYNYFTYIPYALMSFFTGISSHNYIIYCNVLMVSAAYIFLIVLLRPTVRQTVWMILFECTELIHARYIWSGMSEAGSIAVTLAVWACFLWLLRQEDRQSGNINFILILQTVLILFYGVIRPFLLVYILLPVYYIVKSVRGRREKAVKLGIIGGALFGSVFLYFFMQEYCCAKYFSSSPEDSFFSYLRSGQMLSLIKFIIKVNASAAQSVFVQMSKFGCIGIVTMGMFLSAVIICVICLLHRNRRDKHYKVQRVSGCLYICIALLVYEANIILYSAEQLHRMLLAPMAAGAVLCCFMFGDAAPCVRQLFTISVMAASILLSGGSSYALPQDNVGLTYQEGESLRGELMHVMPDDDSKNRWDLGIAFLPVYSDMQIMFCFPAYISGSTCNENYMYSAIDSDTLKSRYILVQERNSDLRARCDAAYHLIWKGYGYLIYSQ